jgi:hypothetical protein
MAILDADPSATDGVFWIDPPGNTSGDLIEAWCDMATDGGGYSFYKINTVDNYYTSDAEGQCATFGLQLFIPRTESHLLSAYDVAVDATFGPSSSALYLSMFGIYPDYDGVSCAYQAMNSDNVSCDFSASDEGPFWVSDRSDILEPNGDNDTTTSLYYDFSTNADGTVYTYSDYPSGPVTRTFICDVGDFWGS